jgi:ATP-binding cassette subfamily B protein
MTYGSAVTAETPRHGTFKLLAATVRPWRLAILLIGVVVLLSAAIELVPPLVVRSVVDGHLAVGRRDGLAELGLLYLGALAAIQATGFCYSYLASWVAQRAINSLRMRLFAHFLRLPIRHHDTTPLGDMVSRCTADVETLETLFSSGVARLLADLVRLGTVAVAMVILSPVLTLVAAIVLPPLVVITRFIQVRIRNAERSTRTAIGGLNTQLHENLGGVEVIRAFGREDRFVAGFRRALERVVTAYNQATKFNAIYPPATVLMSALVVALLLWTGSQDVIGSWGVSLGTLVAFIFLFQRFFAPVTALGDEWQTVQAALAGAERIARVLALPVERDESAPVRPSPGLLDAPVAMSSVTFGYGEPIVLDGISFSARAAEHVAIVGRTGAGKSTMLGLLGGLYRPWSGTVRIMGVDPSLVPDADRRRIMAVVPQTVQLFGGSVLDNLTLGDDSLSFADVVKAATLTGAGAFIESLPHGYATRLDASDRDGGTQLSEGQRQLISLTRALVFSAPVLLLDEATSAVDAASDQSFRTALRRISAQRGTAVVTVAHRLSTAREADRVIVMEAGRIIEEGTPAELVTLGGMFAAFVELEEYGWDWRVHERATG